MKESEYSTIGSTGRAGMVVRVIVLILVVTAIFVAIILGSPKNEDLGAVWDERTTIGSKDAKNHYVMTTDIMCPYCDYFSRALMSHQEDFEKWLADNDVRFEVRITDFLNEYGEAGVKSEQAAEAAYCATKEDKFWDFYHNAMKSLDEDYHSKGIGNAKGAPHIENMTADYWVEVGREVGLGDSFEDCYRNHDELAHMRENTAKVAKLMQKSNISGMPYFKFEDFETSGFDNSWGWEEAKNYLLDAGLKK